MAIAKITGQGLAAIAFSVAVLWGCLIGERALAKQAYAERIQVLRETPRIPNRPHTQPVSAPGLRPATRPVVTEG